MKKVGAITVGQAPRVDMTPEMIPLLGDSVMLIEKGGLDGLTREEIETFLPREGDHVLVSRMTDGSSVTFGESWVLPKMQEKIDELVAEGVSLILFLCTGEFPDDFSCPVPMLFPNRILTAAVSAATSRNSRLAVLTPSSQQIPQMYEKWSPYASFVTVAAVSPYKGKEAVAQAARELRRENPDLIVLDCMGFTVEMKEAVREATGKPVFLPRTLVARYLAELA